jgi:hypothetical protein
VGSSLWTTREPYLLPNSRPLTLPQSNDKYRLPTRNNFRASIRSSRTVILRKHPTGTAESGPTRMESASRSGSRGHPHCRHYCESATINRSPGAWPLNLDWFLFSFYSKQLSFALGTPIPIYLELHSRTAPTGSHPIDIRLIRTLITHSVTGGVRIVDVARAVLWEAPGSSPLCIKVWGEITIGRRLTPTFDFSKCSIQVHLFSAFLVDMSS